MKKLTNTKNKGFTLIELLAVIVVLAILALIAVPTVLNIIKDARNNSNKRSIESYARAIDYAVSEYMSENPDQEIVTWEDVKDKVEYKGKVECQWGENLSSISHAGEITLHGCKVNNKTNSVYGYVDGKVVEEENGKYKKYSIGDKITYKGMKFYVIAPSDTKQDYVTLLKAEPLTYDEVNTLKQSTELKNDIYNYNGYGGISYSATETCGYMNGSWGNTNCSNDYDSSSIKQILQVWSDPFNSELKEDSLGYKARLITFDELTTNLGYSIKSGNTWYSATADVTPNWVYNSNYYYWTMSPWNDSASMVWYVRSSGDLNGSSVSYDGGVVRPLINLLKSAIQ